MMAAPNKGAMICARDQLMEYKAIYCPICDAEACEIARVPINGIANISDKVRNNMLR